MLSYGYLKNQSLMPVAVTTAGAANGTRTHLSVLEPFSKHRRYHSPICKALAMDEDTRDVAKAIGNCALNLGIEVEMPDGEEPQPKLRAVRACNRRVCPFCEWRRTKALRRRFFEGLPKFHEDFPTHKPIFLTLTVRNVAIEDLKTSITDLHLSWKRMTKCSFFPTPFWFRKTEVTIDGSLSHREGTAMVHPHLHCLLMVPAGYFSHGYIRQTEWQKQWMMAARLDYAPVIDVRKCRGRPGSSATGASDALGASMEASKYAAKATDLIKLGDSLGEYHRQVRGVRLTGVSVPLQPYISAAEVSQDELTDGGESSPVESVRGTAVWFEDLEEYLFESLT